MKQEALKASKEAAASGRSLRARSLCYRGDVCGVTLFLLPLLVLLDLLGSWMPREGRVHALGTLGCSSRGMVCVASITITAVGSPARCQHRVPSPHPLLEEELPVLHPHVPPASSDQWMDQWSCSGSLCHPSVHNDLCKRDREGSRGGPAANKALP